MIGTSLASKSSSAFLTHAEKEKQGIYCTTVLFSSTHVPLDVLLVHLSEPSLVDSSHRFKHLRHVRQVETGSEVSEDPVHVDIVSAPVEVRGEQVRMHLGYYVARFFMCVQYMLLQNLPANVVGNIGKHLTARNKAALVIAGKANGATAIIREKLKKLEYLLRRLAKRKSRTYKTYIKLYRWINSVEKRIVGRRTNDRPLSLKNITEIKRNLLKTMKPIKIGEEIKFSSNNKTAVLHVKKVSNRATIAYIEKNTKSKSVPVTYRIVPGSPDEPHIYYNNRFIGRMNTIGFTDPNGTFRLHDYTFDRSSGQPVYGLSSSRQAPMSLSSRSPSRSPSSRSSLKPTEPSPGPRAPSESPLKPTGPPPLRPGPRAQRKK